MLTITVDDSAFRTYLKQLQKDLGDLYPVMDSIGNALETRVRQRFQTRTDPQGQPWSPWRESTQEGYPFPGSPAAAVEGPGNGRLLDRHGTMLSLLSYNPDNTSVRIGFASEYAEYHEWGTVNMDRRGMLMADPDAGTLGENDEAAVLDILAVWLDDLAQ